MTSSQLLATDNGLYVRDVADGRLTLHTPLEADNAATRSNDGRVHPCGALWVGTMGRKAEKGAGAIYHFHRGELSRLYAGVSIPNAICFSPDGATAYFTDTSEAILHRVAIDPPTAMPIGEPADALRSPRRNRRPRWRRGRCAGADLECALGRRLRRCLHAGRPTRSHHPRAGEAVELPGLCRREISTGCSSLPPGRAWMTHAKAADPHHGKTFILDVGASGRAEPRVKLAERYAAHWLAGIDGAHDGIAGRI